MEEFALAVSLPILLIIVGIILAVVDVAGPLGIILILVGLALLLVHYLQRGRTRRV